MQYQFGKTVIWITVLIFYLFSIPRLKEIGQNVTYASSWSQRIPDQQGGGHGGQGCLTCCRRQCTGWRCRWQGQHLFYGAGQEQRLAARGNIAQNSQFFSRLMWCDVIFANDSFSRIFISSQDIILVLPMACGFEHFHRSRQGRIKMVFCGAGQKQHTREAPFFKCLDLGKNFRSCGSWTYNNGDLEWPLSNIRTCLMIPYYKLYV